MAHIQDLQFPRQMHEGLSARDGDDEVDVATALVAGTRANGVETALVADTRAAGVATALVADSRVAGVATALVAGTREAGVATVSGAVPSGADDKDDGVRAS
jgi:hypothetical protein